MPLLKANLRLSLKNILFTTDFTAASDSALPYAMALAKWYGSKILVAHCVPPEPTLSMPMEPMPQTMDFNWQSAGRKMKEFTRTSPLADMRYETFLLQGELWHALSDLSRRQQVDLMVLGTHGREGIKKLVMGSSAELIFRRARCPVLTVGPKASNPSVKFENWKHILFATDFSAGSLNALPYALSLAEENKASLTLLHLIPLIPMQEEKGVLEAARMRLELLVPIEATHWCTPQFLVEYGFPSDGILRVAEDQRADLLVMGVHPVRSPRASAHLPWATASEVVSHAHCPVLTVRG